MLKRDGMVVFDAEGTGPLTADFSKDGVFMDLVKNGKPEQPFDYAMDWLEGLLKWDKKTFDAMAAEKSLHFRFDDRVDHLRRVVDCMVIGAFLKSRGLKGDTAWALEASRLYTISAKPGKPVVFGLDNRGQKTKVLANSSEATKARRIVEDIKAENPGAWACISGLFENDSIIALVNKAIDRKEKSNLMTR